MAPSRRDFLSLGAAALSGAFVGAGPLRAAARAPRAASHADRPASGRATPQYESRRPPAGERRFTSDAVEATIRRVSRDIADPELGWLFANCFPNTLDTTVHHGTVDGRPDTFVITGDIEAMWLRDSSAQVWPYLPLAREDAPLRRLIAGVIHRQTRCIRIDPYANAFYEAPKPDGEWQDDLTDMKPELHERKWEVDSLCYPIRLAHGYWKATGDTSVFTSEWREAMRSVLRTFHEQQRIVDRGPYRFQRVTAVATDTVPLGGWGNPVRPVGLICSIFRPSDDATIYPFLVPSNLFAVVSLAQLAEISRAVTGDATFAAECEALSAEVERALMEHAVVEHPTRGRLWAYEVDGYGNRLHMDDANVPSLLSLPYLGCCAPRDPLYQATRAFVLSEDNPYFFRGTAAEGIGGPHVGLEMIWPMAITMRALTSTDAAEIRAALRTLTRTHGGTGFMHESFHQDDPSRFTRSWFAWANTLFGELVLTVHAERPELLRG